MEIRGRIQVLLGELYRIYMITSCREDMRNFAAKQLRNGMLFFLFLFAVTYSISSIASGELRSKGAVGLPTTTAVFFAGAMGGFVSAQRRLQSVSKRGESLIDLVELSSPSGYWLAPITGAVFASVLYIMFIGGLISGSLFPYIGTPSEATKTGLTFAEFARGTGPSTGMDWAKLMVWCFIAGFAERFVPDALDRLVSRSEKKETAG